MILSDFLTPVGIATGSVITLLDILLARGEREPVPNHVAVFDKVRLPTGEMLLDRLEKEGLVRIQRWEDGEIQRLVTRRPELEIFARIREIGSECTGAAV